MLDEGKQDIPDTAIDRAHWIGPESSPYKCKAIFVRFTMFCHRTVEKIKNNVKAISNLFSNGRKGILILYENNHCITQYKNICFFLNIFCFL